MTQARIEVSNEPRPHVYDPATQPELFEGVLSRRIVAFLMPRIMLAVGGYSTIAAGLIAVAFVAAFFLIFWLRGRSRGGDS